MHVLDRETGKARVFDVDIPFFSFYMCNAFETEGAFPCPDSRRCARVSICVKACVRVAYLRKPRPSPLPLITCPLCLPLPHLITMHTFSPPLSLHPSDGYLVVDLPISSGPEVIKNVSMRKRRANLEPSFDFYYARLVRVRWEEGGRVGVH